MQHAIGSRERKLDEFFQRAKKKAPDDEVVSDLSKLAAVLTCGCVERCVEIVILERLTSRAHTRVLKFIQAHFKRGRITTVKLCANLWSVSTWIGLKSFGKN